MTELQPLLKENRPSGPLAAPVRLLEMKSAVLET